MDYRIIAFSLLIIIGFYQIISLPYRKLARQKRIIALKNGAPEVIFEELRSLETYPKHGVSYAGKIIRLLIFFLCIGIIFFLAYRLIQFKAKMHFITPSPDSYAPSSPNYSDSAFI
jgi:hypothetical protein